MFCAASIDYHPWIKLQTHTCLRRGTQQVRRELSPELINTQSRHCPALGFVHAGQVAHWLLWVGAGMGEEGKMLKKKGFAKENGSSLLIHLHSPPCNVRYWEITQPLQSTLFSPTAAANHVDNHWGLTDVSEVINHITALSHLDLSPASVKYWQQLLPPRSWVVQIPTLKVLSCPWGPCWGTDQNLKYTEYLQRVLGQNGADIHPVGVTPAQPTT